MYVQITETEPCCANCTHYHQHYVRSVGQYGDARYMMISHGHCAYPRMKDRKVLDLCEHYEARNQFKKREED